MASGDLTIRPDQLLPDLQAKLQNGIVAGVGAGKLPANYPYSSLSVSAHSKTQTIAVGPQLAYRHFSKATLFFRPVYAGIMHEAATPQPQDAVVKALVSSLITTPTKTDNVLFIGFGGGFDILFGHHFAWRTQADLVYDHLFTDLHDEWPLHHALLLRSGLQLRPEYREEKDRGTQAPKEADRSRDLRRLSFHAALAAGGIWLIARSASAQIVRLGLTPRLAAITEPSQTYRFW